MKMIVLTAALLGASVLSALADESLAKRSGSKVEVLERIVVDKIWPAVPVRYCLLTHGQMQYVAYYNADRRMVVAQRKLGEDTFEKFVLPSESSKPPRHSRQTSTIQGWDSHNYITMVVDSDGYIHLSGNIHVDPLLYFRSEKPGDITTLKQIKSMVGKDEDRCTYPKFMAGPDGLLLFHYRDGRSGDGVEIYNAYDTKTKAWRRFLDQPLVSGLGKVNAYPMGPRHGPDGMYHLAWMWRQTRDCATNHDISYARSPDLVNWQTATGEPLKLPITPEYKATIIDPVPIRAGLINMRNGIGFDSDDRVIVTYHKYDKDGNNQAYAARVEDGKWVIRQLSEWKHRWEFGGPGSIPGLVGVGDATPHSDGTLALPYRHVKYGDGVMILDEASLKLLRTEAPPQRYPQALKAVTSTFKPDRGSGMQVNWFEDIGKSPDADTHYVLRWETLGGNRDRPRKGKLPENSDLVLYKINEGKGGLTHTTSGADENDMKRFYEDLARVQEKRMSDERFFGRWDAQDQKWSVNPVLRYNEFKDLNAVEDNAKTGDYKNAKRALLAYYKNKDDLDKPDLMPVTERGKHMAEAIRAEIYQYWTMERSLTDFTVNNQWQRHSIALAGQLYSVYGIMNWKRQGQAGIRSREDKNYAPVLEVVTDKQTYEIKATADTYLRAGEHAKENYGQRDVLLCQEAGAPLSNDTMRPYIYFDLPRIDGEVEAVKLHVYARSMEPGSDISLLVLGAAQWTFFDEKSVTWNDHTPQTFSYRDMDYDWAYPPGAEREWLMLTTRMGGLKNVVEKYLETGDESYAFAALHRIINFYAHRDAAYPRILEVAGRGDSLPRAFLYLLNSDSMTPEVAVALLKFIHENADVLSKAHKRSSGNFATAIQTGWMNANAYLPEICKEGWWETNTRKMTQIVDRSTLPDGSYTESCAGYLHGVLRGNIKPFVQIGAARGQRLAEMEEDYRQLTRYFRDTTLPGGRRIKWGDGGGSPGDWVRGIVLEAAELLDDPELIYFGSNGEKGTKPNFYSTCYPVGQVVNLRTSWLDEDGLGAFMNARIGGSHSHPDALALDIHAYGQYLLADPGTGSYNSADKPGQWQRKTTIAHNTIEINGRPQSRPQRRWTRNSGIELAPSRPSANHRVGVGDIFDHITAWHTAYKGFKHERRVLFVRPSHWIVSDRIIAPDGKHTYRQAWHPERHNHVKIQEGTKAAHTHFASGPNVQIIPADPESLKADTPSGYMNSLPEKYVTYSKENAAGHVVFDTVIYPTREGQSTPVSVKRSGVTVGNQQLKATDATALTLKIGNDRNAVYFQSYRKQDAPVQFAGCHFDGDMVYVETSDDGGLYVAMLGGSKLAAAMGNREEILIECKQTVDDLGLRMKGVILEIETTNEKQLSLTVNVPGAVDQVKLNGRVVSFAQKDGVLLIEN